MTRPDTPFTPLRVAIFSDTFAPQVNGVARTLGRLAEALEARGHVVRVYTTSDPDAARDDGVVRYPGRAFWAYPQLQLSLPRRPLVRRDLAAWSPSIVHVATPFGLGLAGSAAARGLGVPVVSSYHTSLTEYARFYRLGALTAPGWAYLRWFHNRALRTYCPTSAIIRELADKRFTGLQLWPRGVDREQFHPGFRSAELREAWGADADTPVVGYVGRIAKEKSIDVVLEAMRLIRLRRPNAKLVIVGDGPYEDEARRLAPKDTLFLGRLSGAALSAAYASLDVFLFPSTTDTFGNVVLEAMSSGAIVVGADVPQTREVMGVGTGLFARPGSANEFADAALRVIGNSHLRNQLQSAGGRAAARQDWSAIWDNLIADYRRVISDRAAAAA